ncbi:hypothetical protein R1T16_00470 [Flavobacterium sp. DG1-102-2]|uniref:hypothetical protein n=1 Tax=Flavobacterium sp. DG1-102-2 TaxID=3081663 RepID=UPI00294A8FFA|nr:hypothetical protein [Flavobacterium sp. DG1-102-2]MDV6166878.1 hypothetical protein [Flavobacterium sp. DG1-102-2]
MQFVKIYDILSYLTPVLLLGGILIAFYFRKTLDSIHKSIAYYLLAMLFTEISGRIIGDYYHNNLIVLLVYSILELVMLAYFYYKHLFKAKHKLILFIVFLAVIYILWEIYVFEIRSIKEFQTYAKVVDNFTIILLSLTFFHEKINIFKESKWDNFRLNAVILAFFSINMLFFLPYNFIINETIGFWFWLGILSSVTLFNSYLISQIWKNGRTRKLLPSGSR